MKKTNAAGSTTLRLRNQQVRIVKNAQFFAGLFVLFLIGYGFCYIVDSAYLGNRNLFTFWNAAQRSLHFVKGESILPALEYTVSASGMKPEVYDATVLFYFTILAYLALGILNAIVTGFTKTFGQARIRKQLEPLYNIARTAMQLSDESDINKSGHAYSDRKIHDLESAIERLNAEKPNAALHTGDSDLVGLEQAINSLLQRTRDSYSQQIRFVSDASHELRTPIAVMKGYTDMLDRWGKDDEKILDESISALKAETEHMNTLVEQLLFLARGDSGRTKLEMELFSLSDIVREVHDESVMIDSQHVWSVYATNEVTAYGDCAMLKQAVRILIDNAAKYSPAGAEIILRAKLDDKGQPTIVVQDNGMGITEDDLVHIFERFYRADPARGTKQGTGLGLSIANWIVDRHNGYMDVISREDIGTRISIHLPKANKDLVPAEKI